MTDVYKSARYCKVRGCSSTCQTTSLFRIPTSDKRRKSVWLEFLNDSSLYGENEDVLKQCRMCVKHFQEIYLSRSSRRIRLLPTAVPTLNPPKCIKQKDIPSSVPTAAPTKRVEVKENREILEVHVSCENIESLPTLAPPYIEEVEVSCLSDVEMSPSPFVREPSEDSDNEASALIPTQNTSPLENTIRTLRVLKTKCDGLNARRSMSRVDRLFINYRSFLHKISNNPLEPKIIFKELEGIHKHPAPDTWTWNDKVLALSILKRSPESYSFLQNLITLPSRDTLTQVLDDFNIEYGLNETIMNELIKKLATMVDDEKNCILMFDEITLTECLDHDVTMDRIDGFENLGECGATNKVATHALVFMVRGLNKTWKQPLCFYMSCGPTPPGVISQLIVKVIEALINIKLNPVATVCDQGQNNVIALLNLAEGHEPCFVVQGRKIVYFYDSPRLLNSIRNNFVEKNVRFLDHNYEVSLAKWEHISQFFHKDGCWYNFANRLTDKHISPLDENERKVKYAAQVFSHTVSVGIAMFVKCDVLPKDAEGTAKFLEIMDCLFDSFNGNKPKPEFKKNLNCWLKKDTSHLAFWESVFHLIENMKFVDRVNGNVSYPLSQKGWLHNIRAIGLLWFLMRDIYEHICMRHLNLEPLDNFFGLIRQFSNDKPSASQFIAAYKTAILNDLTCSSPMYETCEADDGKLLCDLKSLSVHIPSCSVKSVTAEDEAFKLSFTDIDMALLVKQSNTYIAGYIVYRLANAGLCKDCLQILRNQESSEDFLIYPPSPACRKFVLSSTMAMFLRARLIFHEPNVGRELRRAAVGAVCSLPRVGCRRHSLPLLETLVNLTTQIVIYTWCKNLNVDIMDEFLNRIDIENTVVKGPRRVRRKPRLLGL